MSKVLVITSSLSKNKSVSSHAVDLFLENYKIINPNDEIELLNLNENKKIQTLLFADNIDVFWNKESDILIDQLKSADKIIISAGLTNFNIPSTLKSYFDNVLQANKTFKYKYEGNGQSVGLLNSNTKVQLILAQGAEMGWYPFALFDKYIEGTLNFMGITKINTIIISGTKTHEKSNFAIDEMLDKEELIKLSNDF